MVVLPNLGGAGAAVHDASKKIYVEDCGNDEENRQLAVAAVESDTFSY